MSPLARAARPTAFVLVAGLLVGVSAPGGRIAPGPPTARAAAVPTLGLDDIHPGQRAVGRTVFAGNTIEEFELEIVGIVPGSRTQGAMILARATGPRMAHDGIAAGMSGSPIYVDGKLIGALAFGWAFSRDPLCGIQPIADMLAVMETPDRAPGGSFEDGPILTTQSAPESATPVRAGLERLRTPLTAGGFPEAALSCGEDLEPKCKVVNILLELACEPRDLTCGFLGLNQLSKLFYARDDRPIRAEFRGRADGLERFLAELDLLLVLTLFDDLAVLNSPRVILR